MVLPFWPQFTTASGPYCREPMWAHPCDSAVVSWVDIGPEAYFQAIRDLELSTACSIFLCPNCREVGIRSVSDVRSGVETAAESPGPGACVHIAVNVCTGSVLSVCLSVSRVSFSSPELKLFRSPSNRRHQHGAARFVADGRCQFAGGCMLCRAVNGVDQRRQF